jgi:hypothetical protein
MNIGCLIFNFTLTAILAAAAFSVAAKAHFIRESNNDRSAIPGCRQPTRAGALAGHHGAGLAPVSAHQRAPFAAAAWHCATAA